MPEASIRRISFERLTLGVLIAGLMWVGGGLLFGAGSLVHLLERSPSRGRISAFHRGAVIAVDRFRPFERIYHAPNTIRTGHAEGRWLTEEVFGFWPREEYSGRAFPFAWAGLAALQDGELVITVRLVYGVVLQRVGIVLMLLALPITLIATDAGVIGGLIAIAVSAFGLRLNWNGLQRERRSARGGEGVRDTASAVGGKAMSDAGMIGSGIFLVIVGIFWVVEQRRAIKTYHAETAQTRAENREFIELQRENNRLLSLIAAKLERTPQP